MKRKMFTGRSCLYERFTNLFWNRPGTTKTNEKLSSWAYFRHRKKTRFGACIIHRKTLRPDRLKFTGTGMGIGTGRYTSNGSTVSCYSVGDMMKQFRLRYYLPPNQLPIKHWWMGVLKILLISPKPRWRKEGILINAWFKLSPHSPLHSDNLWWQFSLLAYLKH